MYSHISTLINPKYLNPSYFIILVPPLIHIFLIQVIINKRIELGRFALMHCIASSLCFWVWTILRETMDSFTHHSIQDKDKNDRISNIPFQSDSEEQPHALSLTSYTKLGARELVKFLNGTSTRVVTSCRYDSRMNFIYENYSPYLYPFTVEYSILVGKSNKLSMNCPFYFSLFS